MNSDGFWYVVYTKPRQEQRALENLTRQGYQCYLPMVDREVIRNQRCITLHEPMFPRYLFIYLIDGISNWHPIRSTFGVSKLVEFGGRAIPVPTGWIETLQGSEIRVEHLFIRDQKVEITDGPFTGLSAKFVELKSNESGETRAFVLLELLQKLHQLEIAVAALKIAA